MNFMSVALARQNSGKDHMRRPCTKKDRPQSSMGIGENIYKLKNADKATFYTPSEARVMSAPTSISPEEREFVVSSRASLHMMSKTRITLR